MSAADAMKLHLRVLEVRGVTLRVVTLRPQTQVRFSTNYFHDTWHVVSDDNGALVLGRLLWGLAFQRHPGTLVLIDGEHLAPTPFEADPSDPIMLVPAGLTSVDVDVLGALKLRLRRAPGAPTTIRWHTFGMAAALEDDSIHDLWHHDEHRTLRSHERMSRRAGFVCYTAPPEILRANGCSIYEMGRHCGGGGGYHRLAEYNRRHWRVDGEFQVVPAYADSISAATVARREVLGGQNRPLASDEERWEVWKRTAMALERLHAQRG